MRKLFVVCCDQDFISGVHPVLQEEYMLYCCSDGAAAMEDYLTFAPDLLAIDLHTPGCDINGILRAAQLRGGQTQILALTYGYDDQSAELLSIFGISQLLILPAPAAAVLHRLHQIEKLIPKESDKLLSSRIDDILQDLGLDSHNVGFACLREALLYKYHNRDCLFSSDLCVHVAHRCGGNAASVSKAMSRCIQKNWRRRNTLIWTFYFGENPESVSAAAFLNAIIRHLDQHSETAE